MFTVAGVSTQHGITKVRFANDLVSRLKVLSKGGHSPLELIELPRPMTKAEACQYLLDQGGVFAQWTNLITETMSKKEGKVTKVKVAKAKTKAPVKAAKVQSAPKTSKKEVKEEKDEFDLMVEELGEAVV